MPFRGRSPWLPLFALSLLSVAASFALLAYVLIDRGDDDSAADPGVATATATGTPVAATTTLYYSGEPPHTLPPDGYARADAAHPADIAFAPDPRSNATAVRYWVPVTSVFTGVEAITNAQADRLFSGDPSFTWASVGGIGDAPELAQVDGPADVTFEEGAGSSVPNHFVTYAELYAAMAKPGNSLAAFVPLDELRPPAVPLVVDGHDILRDPSSLPTWPFVERISVTALTDHGRGALAAVQAAIEAKPPVVTRIAATGDVLMSRCSLTAIRATGDWGSPLRNPVGQFLAGADLALTSLDASIQDIGEPLGCVDSTNLTSPPEVIQALTLAGIDEATVATNHVFDCGEASPCGTRGFLRMLDLLHTAGIKTVGGGANLDEAFAPALFEINGIKFGVIGVDDIAAEDLEATDTEAGTAPMDDTYDDEHATPPEEPAFYKPPELLEVSRLEEKIRALKTQVDVVIVQPQSGTEDTHDPSPRSLKGLRAAADAGADLVIGNQAHWVQAIEMRGSSFIAYALGNFIFDQVHTPEHTQGYIVEATFVGKQLATVRLLPYNIVDQYHPEFVQGATRTKIMQDVVTASDALPAAP